jgi:dihydrofolate reductase
MSSTRKVILYIATSLDGYIAAPNDDLSFLSVVQKEGEDYGYGDFIQSVDTVIMGRKTYDWVMTQVPEFPHADKEAYIITRNERKGMGNTHFYTRDLEALILQLKSGSGKNIFIDGGAQVVNELLEQSLIDEFVISIIPVLLGRGTRLFQDGRPLQKLKHAGTKSYDTGLVQLHYVREAEE